MLTLITPTCDRPVGIALCERWMTRQTIQPDQWIVADGGQTPARLTMGQDHVWQKAPAGAGNLAGNILAGIDAARGDMVLIIEDDDYYHADHLAHCVERLKFADACGFGWLHYYHVAARRWIKLPNTGSALCQTGLRRKLLPALASAAKAAARAGDYRIDGRFWAGRTALAMGRQTVVGIKGLPGTVGLGVGHRPFASGRAWIEDPEGRILSQWIGADAEPYLRLADGAVRDGGMAGRARP